ncbi:hypothetical protein DMC30DRAFT_414178 [Rhodotorula diobovata]|uniref:Nucleolus and neural progenitor protein-like N-terminal domain-containing protein n=1 Tax=Rhodotorula diobovata TaxID=5288 RepID=A0A5C5G2W6_9BASI|nr:hypothetical protein DMC30DRAFT_414178 [Rhodotorula diobovata]
MSQTLSREPPKLQLDLPVDPAAPPPAFPGLVSSVRPLRRLAAQLADETALLRRFTYKHKNQHKGHGWWKRVVQVDRVANRALAEVQGWLADIGCSADKDDVGPLTREAVCAGLLRLPRVMLVVEKNLEVLLSTATILEQLVESRAFLAFALVVVALAARLHALFAALFDECGRTAATLLRLVESNGLMTSMSSKIQTLPRTLRRFLTLDASALPSAAPSLAPSASATRRDSPLPIGTLDELGAAVERKPPTPRATAASAAPQVPARLSDLKKSKVKRALVDEASSRESTPSSLFPFPLDASAATSAKVGPPASDFSAPSKPLKRPRREAAGEQPPPRVAVARVRDEAAAGASASLAGADETEKALKPKKKKKKRAGGDEIDAIFG